MGGGKGGEQRQPLQEQTGMERYNAVPKGETHISGQQQHWAKYALCLSDVVAVDGFLNAPSCFSLLKSHFIHMYWAGQTNIIIWKDCCLFFYIETECQLGD